MLQSDPKCLAALRGLAAQATEKSDFEAALHFYEQLIELGERSVDVLFNAAMLYERDGRLDEAAAYYRATLDQEPDMPEALLNLGRVLEATGRSDQALSCWSKALESDPELAQGYFGPEME